MEITNSSLSGLASNGRQSGVVGSILIPGVAFSIVMWLLVTNAKRSFLDGIAYEDADAAGLLTILFCAHGHKIHSGRLITDVFASSRLCLRTTW